MFEECSQNLYGRGQDCHVATLLQEVRLVGLNRFESSTDFLLYSVKIGLGCMNLVTVVA